MENEIYLKEAYFVKKLIPIPTKIETWKYLFRIEIVLEVYKLQK
jgi:hypothetical protein